MWLFVLWYVYNYFISAKLLWILDTYIQLCLQQEELSAAVVTNTVISWLQAKAVDPQIADRIQVGEFQQQ